MSFSSRFSLLNSFNSTPNSNKTPSSNKRTSSAKRKLCQSRKSSVKPEKKRIEFDSEDDILNPNIEEYSADSENFSPDAVLQLKKITKRSILNDSKMSFKSPDKSEILPFLSCDPNEFNNQTRKTNR